MCKACFWVEVSPLILLSFIEFIFGMSFTYLTLFLSFLAYDIGQADAYCQTYQISKQASLNFDETMRQDRLPINMSVAGEPMLLPAYIEDCRIKLWKHVFRTYFRWSDSLKKMTTLMYLLDLI